MSPSSDSWIPSCYSSTASSETTSRQPATNITAYSRAPPIPEVEHTDGSEHSLVDVDSEHVSTVPSDFTTQSIQTSTQAERIEREEEDRQRAQSRKEKAQHTKEKAKAKARKVGRIIKMNADNPVVLGNTVLVVLLTGGLGYVGYTKHRAGQLSWKLVGIGAGIVGAFSAADYFLTS
jgi:hypothetical protein